MSGARFEIRYDGEALAGHSMDVQHLAPALLAIGNLIREANAQFNGDRSKVRVLVQSDFEHKCFSVTFEVFQSLLDQMATLIKDDEVRSAKDILEWLGILAGGTLTAGTTLFGLLRWLGRNREANITEIKDSTVGGDVTLRAGDGNQITVNNNVYLLASNPKVRNAAADITAPLRTDGFSSLEFRSEDPKTPVISFVPDDARDVAQSLGVDLDSTGEEIKHEPQEIIAHLSIHSAVFDPEATHWRFLYGGDRIRADIRETSIAEEAVRRGRVSMNDRYKVNLEITEYETPKGQFRKAYKIKSVLEFQPATLGGYQLDMFNPRPASGA